MQDLPEVDRYTRERVRKEERRERENEVGKDCTRVEVLCRRKEKGRHKGLDAKLIYSSLQEQDLGRLSIEVTRREVCV